MRTARLKSLVVSFTAALATALLVSGTARARDASTDASALSALPVAVSVMAPASMLAAGAMFTVAAVEKLSDGTVWVLERASDGARFSVKLGAAAVEGVSVAAGAVVATTVISTGWVLSTAGRAVAFIPNEVGKALLYNERVTR